MCHTFTQHSAASLLHLNTRQTEPTLTRMKNNLPESQPLPASRGPPPTGACAPCTPLSWPVSPLEHVLTLAHEKGASSSHPKETTAEDDQPWRWLPVVQLFTTSHLQVWGGGYSHCDTVNPSSLPSQKGSEGPGCANSCSGWTTDSRDSSVWPRSIYQCQWDLPPWLQGTQ